MLERIEKIAKVVQHLTIIGAIIGGAFSLLASQVDRRVTRTLEFYKEYVGEVRKEALAIDLKWVRFAQKQGDIFHKTIAEQKKIAFEFFDDPENQKGLLLLVAFYDTLYVCVQNRACDRNVAVDLFRVAAHSTFELSGHYIFDLRDKNKTPALGMGLEGIYHLGKESWIYRYL